LYPSNFLHHGRASSNSYVRRRHGNESSLKSGWASGAMLRRLNSRDVFPY
jgi:hypothetical protein